MQRVSRRHSNVAVARAVSAVLWAAASALTPATLLAAEAATEEKKGDDVTELSDLEVTDDPLRALSNEASASSFGFSKPLLETPRSVSFISEEQIRLFGISTVEDLTRIVPGTYTTTRYGLQGGVQVRGVPADYYYRGMKRINQQGHARTVLSAMDNIEVVKGPPSPIYGIGLVGGYVNLDPKSSRARTGKYLAGTKGFVQGIYGTYDRSEMSLGFGGPFKVGEKQAGYYIYSLLENSNSYTKQVGVQQRFLQGTASIDNFVGPFRLEFGGQGQQSVTSGGYMNRGSQRLIDTGQYLTGQPLVNLDLNGDGAVGFLERNQASPAAGNLSAANQALTQRFAWPTDANGNFLSTPQRETVAGIPQSMLDYLNSPAGMAAANCRAADVMRTMPAGGPTPVSGAVPVGMVLNPCQVGYTDVDWRRNGAFEREQNAKQALAYADLIYDVNPDFTLKNQMFFDLLDSFKDSYLPYGEKQDIHIFEEKFTATKRISDEYLPSWLRVNSLASVNYRRTKGSIKSSGADYDGRQDVMYRDGHLVPNTSFWTQLNNPDALTGAQDTRYLRSVYDEKGVGTLFDIDIARNTNVLVGGRYDWSKATATNNPKFNELTGTSANPGRLCPCPGITRTESNDDKGASWSASLSHQLPWLGLRPYFTIAKTSLTLSASNNTIDPATIASANGHLGESEIKELGIKSSMFNNKLQVTVAAYEQSRTDITQPDDPTAFAEVSSTKYQGVETEIKWQPIKDLYMSAYALFQDGVYTIAATSAYEIDGRIAGFQDVVDPATGQVIYPAEAFLYGGRTNTALPGSVATQYLERNGNPETQLGMSTTYQIGRGFGMQLNANYFSKVWANRLQTIRLPKATTVNVGFTWDKNNWHLKLNGYNVNDERYFRGASFDSYSGYIFSVMPGRRIEFTVKTDF